VIVLVLGGTRSGKSEVAEHIAQRLGGDITYLATGTATDPDMAQRIAHHRDRRPAHWHTIEAHRDVAALAAGIDGTLLIDSLGTWVAGAAEFAVDIDELCAALRVRPGHTIVVSEEVGLGVHAPSEVGRHFADVVGSVNQRVATIADRVLLVVAGRAIRLDDVNTLLEEHDHMLLEEHDHMLLEEHD
jgi:adenosyl cobinamide kinase/adenosyl cobinamide phosphate guanylyltransferase